MRRYSIRPVANTADDLHERWCAAIVGSFRGDTDAVDEACRYVVAALSSRPDQLDAALGQFGRELGGEGWLLTELTAWVAELASMAGDAGALLRRFDAGVALAHGWVDGYLYCVQAFDCTDSLTGLVTLPVLRLRLGQIYDQCAALGVPANQVYCLAVVDTDFGDRPPLERDAAMIVVGDHVLQTYQGGETAAVKDGTVVIVASRTESTREQFLGLLAELHQHPLLVGGKVTGRLEELPGAAHQLERFLLALCT